jgi:hypothetical protein
MNTHTHKPVKDNRGSRFSAASSLYGTSWVLLKWRNFGRFRRVSARATTHHQSSRVTMGIFVVGKKSFASLRFGRSLVVIL